LTSVTNYIIWNKCFYANGVLYGFTAGLVLCTIAEDIATFGAGLWNDWQSFMIAYKIIRIAKSLPKPAGIGMIVY
jgi:hypothetical protein